MAEANRREAGYKPANLFKINANHQLKQVATMPPSKDGF
jgi:hypothetical protein